MVESRCGILCSKFEYKEPMKCDGCTNITKPFWGVVMSRKILLQK